jgi:hypothetical protein
MDRMTHIFDMHLQVRDHVLLDDEVRLVEVLDDVIVFFAVDVDDDGLDGRLALDEDTWYCFSHGHGPLRG